MCTSFQLVSTNVCSDHNREDNASGCLIGGELFPSPSVYHCLCFLSNLQILSSQIIVLCPFFVSRYLSEIRVLGFVLFLLLFLFLYCFLWRSLTIFWSGMFRCLTRPHPIVASLFVLFPSFHSRRPSLYITFSPTLSLHYNILATQKRGE